MASRLLEDEAQTLEQRYQPQTGPMETSWDLSDDNMKRIIKRCHDFGCFNVESAQLHEEQERQLSIEKEEERRIERPAPATPCNHFLHDELGRLVTASQIRASSSAFVPASQTLRQATAAKNFDVSQLAQDLLVTSDFSQTVNLVNNSVSDSFVRPVQWLLTNATHIVIISPFEA